MLGAALMRTRPILIPITATSGGWIPSYRHTIRESLEPTVLANKHGRQFVVIQELEARNKYVCYLVIRFNCLF